MAVFKQMEVIANNLANMNTAGFKSEKLVFEKALTDQRGPTGSLRSDISEPGRLRTEEYASINGTYTDFSQGSIQSSGNPLDIAINGEGLFVVLTPDGERYTRSGEFRLDANGRMVTHDGAAVQGTGGDIVITGGQPTVSNNGTVLVNGESVGQLRLVQPNEGTQLLRETKQRFYIEGGGSMSDVEQVQVRGGAVEASNVNAVVELTDMIMASRIFEAMESTNEASSNMSRARNRVFDGSA